MLARVLAIWLAFFPALAFAQSVTLPGFPPGVFQSRAAIDAPTGGGAYTPQGVLFDSTTTASWTERTSQLIGIADSKVGTFSSWVFFPSGGASVSVFSQGFGSGGSQNVLNWSVSNLAASIALTNSANATILSFFSATGSVSQNAWHHILMSWDLSVPVFQMYIDDVADPSSPTTITNATINYSSSGGQWFFNIPIGGTNDMAVADTWFDPTSRMDLSVTANRRKFIDGSGKAVFLGSSGQLPTGSSPISFNTGPFGGWNTNLGTGGNYTQGSGTLAASATNPP